MIAQRYDGVVLCCPVTEPYVRRSEHGAAWFLARALRRLLDASDVEKSDIDGLCVCLPVQIGAIVWSKTSIASDRMNDVAEPLAPVRLTPGEVGLAPVGTVTTAHDALLPFVVRN